ncbi:MAG: hypothetical protein U0703_19385 [Anaerolineae bacterium]
MTSHQFTRISVASTAASLPSASGTCRAVAGSYSATIGDAVPGAAVSLNASARVDDMLAAPASRRRTVALAGHTGYAGRCIALRDDDARRVDQLDGGGVGDAGRLSRCTPA